MADEPGLRRLLRENPMDGAIRVTLEREPDAFLAAAAEGAPHATAVVRAPDGQIVAMGSRAVMDVFVDGEPRRVGYLSQLRVDRRYRGRLRPLAEGFDVLRGTRAPGEQPFDLTSIVADNAAARRLLGAGLPGLPAYRPLEPFVTLVIPTRRVRPLSLPSVLRLERGSDERLPAIAACLERNNRRFQFARRFSADDLRSSTRCRELRPADFLVALAGDTVVGCLALWDQSGFKQVVVQGYAPSLARWRTVLNLAAPLLGTPRLPDPGQALRQVFLSHVAVDDDAPEVFEPLLTAALAAAHGRREACVVAGFAARHPLLGAVRRRCRARAYESLLHVVEWDGVAARFDGRIPHMEVALL